MLTRSSFDWALEKIPPLEISVDRAITAKNLHNECDVYKIVYLDFPK